MTPNEVNFSMSSVSVILIVRKTYSGGAFYFRVLRVTQDLRYDIRCGFHCR